jgi:hypothetical protein
MACQLTTGSQRGDCLSTLHNGFRMRTLVLKLMYLYGQVRWDAVLWTELDWTGLDWTCSIWDSDHWWGLVNKIMN